MVLLGFANITFVGLSALLAAQAPPQGAPAGPGQGPVQGGQPQGPVFKPQGGAQPPGVQQLPAPDSKAQAPKMTPEEIAARLAEQLTGLAGRVQSLRRLAKLPQNDSNLTGEVPPATLEGIRRALGDISREVQTRAHTIEMGVATETAQKLSQPAARTLPQTTLKPAPEPKRDAQSQFAGPAPVLSRLPDLEPGKEGEVAFTVNGLAVTRGEIDEFTKIMFRWTPELTRDVLAQRAIGSAIIPVSVRKARFGSELQPVIAKAKTLRDEIVGGKKAFEASAKELSEDPSTKPFGGLIDGWKPSLLSPFELMAISKLKPGEVSEPFVTSLAVEFIQLLELNENSAHMSDSSIKMRRIMFAIPGVENDANSLMKKAQVDVIDERYESLLPPQVPRKVTGKSKK